MSDQSHQSTSIDSTVDQSPQTMNSKQNISNSQIVENGSITQLDESHVVSTPTTTTETIISDTTTIPQDVITSTIDVIVETDQPPQPPLQPDDLVCLGTNEINPLPTPNQLNNNDNTDNTHTILPTPLDDLSIIPTSPLSTQTSQVQPTPQQNSQTTSNDISISTTPASSQPTILRASKRSLRPIEDDSIHNDPTKRSRQPSSLLTNNLSTTNSIQSSSSSTTTTTTTATTTTTTTTNSTNNQNPQSSANKILVQQFKELAKNPPTGISVDIDQGNLHRWKIVMLGPPGTPYEGGIFPCILQFPTDYPTHPPSFSFSTPNFPHPNVFADGKVCISILHDATDSNYEHEPQSERWKPILGVEAILLSVMSLLSEPNTNSPANVEMSKLYKENEREYRKRIIMMVRRSQEEALNKQ